MRLSKIINGTVAGEVVNSLAKQGGAVAKTAKAVIAVGAKKVANFVGDVVMIDRKSTMALLLSGDDFAADSARSTLGIDHRLVSFRSKPEAPFNHPVSCAFSVGVIPVVRYFFIAIFAAVVKPSACSREEISGVWSLAKSANPFSWFKLGGVRTFPKVGLKLSDMEVAPAEGAGNGSPRLLLSAMNYPRIFVALRNVLVEVVHSKAFSAVLALVEDFRSSHKFHCMTVFTNCQAVTVVK